MRAVYAPLLLQGTAMFADEVWFHERRGLPLWERIGHPLDSLTVLCVYAYLLWGGMNLSVYIGICAFSCIFITKDELVHAEACEPREHWLHAVLFVLHPVVFLSAYQLWRTGQVTALRVQFSIVALFALYQALRWRRHP